MEKKVRKRKTRRGKKKNRKFLTKPFVNSSCEQQQIATPVIHDGQFNKNNAGDVQRSGNHANTPSQRSFIEIDHRDEQSNGNGNLPVSDVGVVPSIKHCNEATVIPVQKVVITLSDDNNHQARMTDATGVNIHHNNNLLQAKPDPYNREDLLVLTEKDNGEQFFNNSILFNF